MCRGRRTKAPSGHRHHPGSRPAGIRVASATRRACRRSSWPSALLRTPHAARGRLSPGSRSEGWEPEVQLLSPRLRVTSPRSLGLNRSLRPLGVPRPTPSPPQSRRLAESVRLPPGAPRQPEREPLPRRSAASTRPSPAGWKRSGRHGPGVRRAARTADAGSNTSPSFHGAQPSQHRSRSKTSCPYRKATTAPCESNRNSTFPTATPVPSVIPAMRWCRSRARPRMPAHARATEPLNRTLARLPSADRHGVIPHDPFMVWAARRASAFQAERRSCGLIRRPTRATLSTHGRSQPGRVGCISNTMATHGHVDANVPVLARMHAKRLTAVGSTAVLARSSVRARWRESAK